MPCDFCAGPGLPGHRYGSLLCQRGANALRWGVLGWNNAHIVACRLVCPECDRHHDPFHAFETCLESHGIFVGWGVPKHRDGTVYRRGPGAAYLVGSGHTAVVDRAGLEQRFPPRRKLARPGTGCASPPTLGSEARVGARPTPTNRFGIHLRWLM